MNTDEFCQEEARPWRRDLPTFYYHGHFTEMLAFVGGHYAHVLGDAERRFIEDFELLSFEAQCLYVRLVNRKGRVFSKARLRYPELGDTRGLLDELDANGWLDRPGREHVRDLLHFLTRAQLLAALRPRFVGMKTTMKKAELMAFAAVHLDDGEQLALLPLDGIFVQGRNDSARFLLFLYFGRVQDGLAQFTMRDLGLVRTHQFTDSYEPRFQDRDEALQTFFFATRLADFDRDPDRLDEFVAEADRWPAAEQGLSAKLRDRLSFRLGRGVEQRGDAYAALRIYQKGESMRCTERVVRLLLKSGQKTEAREFLERCIADPSSDEEALLASDLYARKFGQKRTSALTDLLRDAGTIELDEANVGAPEQAAVDDFRRRGVIAFRTENSLWRSFFGILFWDLLFAGKRSSRHSPFENLPASLLDGRFCREQQAAIEARLELLDDRAALRREVLRTCVAHYGRANGVFRWRRRTLDALHAMIDVLTAAQMRPMLERFCREYPRARTGYPDLMLIEDGALRFVEIKTDGDSVRRNQLLRIEQLRAAGIAADVLRVRWILDPSQDYVVVDVETTGGRGERHRVTEIGAVRVRNGRIEDRFQTLLNPQRGIPPNISRLTGITPEMVADAPVFADIAEEFADFLGDAIFVAHNVDFDYGFIGREFARLGRSFRMPKLCTCASMRRLYPGHRSYSLAALSAAYDIRLAQHHRALCDAEAAAELLLLINERREQRLTTGA